VISREQQGNVGQKKIQKNSKKKIRQQTIGPKNWGISQLNNFQNIKKIIRKINIKTNTKLQIFRFDVA